MVAHILTKLEQAYLRDSGFTVAELLQDAQLSGYTTENLQSVVDTLEGDKLVTAHEVAGRGKVYRLKVFASIQGLCREMPRKPSQLVIQ